MADSFSTYSNTLASPIVGAEAVDISTTNHTCSETSRAIWVGTGGNLIVDLADSTGITFTNVQDGTLLPARVAKVIKTSTTASNMVVVW